MVASAAAASGVEGQEELQGPFDIDDFDDPSVAVLARLDFGLGADSMPAAGQVQVELTERCSPQRCGSSRNGATALRPRGT